MKTTTTPNLKPGDPLYYVTLGGEVVPCTITNTDETFVTFVPDEGPAVQSKVLVSVFGEMARLFTDREKAETFARNEEREL